MNEQQQIEEFVDDLMACHTEFYDNAELYTDYYDMARNLAAKGYVKQRRGTWIDLGDQRCQCSECGSVRYGNSKACIIEYHLAPYCEKCGAFMQDDQ